MRYYNDNDPKAAKWLLALKEDGVIGAGTIDNRSIEDVVPADLTGFTRCHFFAGIAGWELALQLAEWPQDRPVWTGSCPCQPFSLAGKGQGDSDPRHLWPQFYRLIAECHPECIFGEQVESAIGKGWLDLVSTDLEAEGYTVGACVLGAHSVGASHIRQRLYWVADAKGGRWDVPPVEDAGEHLEDDGKAGPLSTIAARGRSGASLRSWWLSEPGMDPVAHGIPRPVVELNRSIGNAIVPETAAMFVRAFLESENATK